MLYIQLKKTWNEKRNGLKFIKLFHPFIGFWRTTLQILPDRVDACTWPSFGPWPSLSEGDGSANSNRRTANCNLFFPSVEKKDLPFTSSRFRKSFKFQLKDLKEVGFLLSNCLDKTKIGVGSVHNKFHKFSLPKTNIENNRNLNINWKKENHLLNLCVEVPCWSSLHLHYLAEFTTS